VIKTQAAVIESPGAPFVLQDIELGELQPNELLVKMGAAGICHTDLTVGAGHIPFPLPGVLGHEGAGTVEAVGSAVTRVAPGDRVVLTFTSCGHCASCRTAHPAYCTTWIPTNLIGGKRADGTSPLSQRGERIGGRFFGQSSFSRYAIADERSTVKVPSDIPFELLAPLGCSSQTGTGAVWNTLRPEPGTSIAVLGVGAVGMASIMAAALTPVGKIIAIGRRTEALELARKFGATHTVNARDKDVVTAVQELTGGNGADVVVEAVGRPETYKQAFYARDLAGTVVLVGVPTPEMTIELPLLDIFGRGGALKSSWYGDCLPSRDFPMLTELYLQGRLDLDAFVTEEIRLDQVEDAFTKMHKGGVLRSVVLFS
jgi:Zn-dependent alcohol dehydrogenase